jgi:hypothetical protein
MAVKTKEPKPPQKLELFQPPQQPPQKETPKPATPTEPQKKKEEYKPIPPEIKIITDMLDEFEGIAYAARQKLYQLYGPVEYPNINEIELKFTEQQAKLLSFNQKGENWIIKPIAYLGQEHFAEIAAKVRELGGEYISAGRESHFRIPRK